MSSLMSSQLESFKGAGFKGCRVHLVDDTILPPEVLGDGHGYTISWSQWRYDRDSEWWVCETVKSNVWNLLGASIALIPITVEHDCQTVSIGTTN
jgi:hypothetical protein